MLSDRDRARRSMLGPLERLRQICAALAEERTLEAEDRQLLADFLSGVLETAASMDYKQGDHKDRAKRLGKIVLAAFGLARKRARPRKTMDQVMRLAEAVVTAMDDHGKSYEDAIAMAPASRNTATEAYSRYGAHIRTFRVVQREHAELDALLSQRDPKVRQELEEEINGLPCTELPRVLHVLRKHITPK